MILAAPLVIPFAKAVGISVATLGMAKAADMVNDYIEANPEESMKILSTIVPSIGIGQIFMNKEKISLEDLDEMTDEEAQDLSKEEKAELMKQAGKSGGPNKRQTMIDISEKLGLSGEGKEKQDIEYDIDERYNEGGVEEVSKPKFDYKKFFRNRRADGGAIGIEVLFGPKREKFNMGGGQFTSGGNISPGTDRRGNVRNDNPFTGGGGGGNTIKVAELTPKQKKFINQQKFGLQENLIPARDIFNKITNPKLGIFDTGTFGFGAQEPTTEEEFNEYLKSIGVTQQVKDGGRVGFDLGGLTGPAKSIYDSMMAAGYFTEDEIRNAIIGAGYEIPGASPAQPEQVTGIINQQLQTGGGRDDNKTGFGKFGNLDPTTERTFVKDVYTIDKNAAPGAPMTGSFKPTEVTGYLNVNTGNYQTLEGKNINHAGLNIKPGIVALMEAIGLGEPKNLTGLPYKEGQIAGTFTGKKLSDFNPFNLFKKQQATIAEINAMNQKAIKDMQAKKAAEEAAKRAATERAIISGGPVITGGGDGGGGNITTRSGDTFAPGDYSDVAGTLADPREKMDYYRDGGLASMFVEKR